MFVPEYVCNVIDTLNANDNIYARDVSELIGVSRERVRQLANTARATGYCRYDSTIKSRPTGLTDEDWCKIITGVLERRYTRTLS